MLLNAAKCQGYSFLSCFFFLIIDLYLLIPAAISQIFSPIAEQLIPIGIPSKQVKAATEIHPVIAEVKIRKCSI